MKKNIFLVVSLVISVLFSYTCNTENKSGLTESILSDTAYFKNIKKEDLNSINELISSFSSPVEMAAIIQDSKIPFAKKYLVDTKITEDYDTNIKKALGLGFLSADLGYLNVYKRNAMMVEYLLSIKTLADDLSIGQFFDFQSLKRLVDSSDNMDSLLFMSTTSFYKMNNYLTKNDRSYLSTCLVTGVWIEGFYLITQVAKDSLDNQLRDLIGTQKDILTNLVIVLKLFSEHPNFQTMLDEFKKLQMAYNAVSITIEKTEPQRIVTDNGIIIIPGEKTTVNISDETIAKIIKITEEVRNNLINLK